MSKPLTDTTGMLWCDKHRPKTLGQLDVHPELTKRLKSIVEAKDFPHLLFYGPSGAGKKTRVMTLLKGHYGPAAGRLRLEQRQIKVSEHRWLDINVVVSTKHLEVNPSDVGIYDRAIAMDLIKGIAESGNVDRYGFKTVVINEADQLTKTAQQALRRTMEKYMRQCRIILVANSLSRIIPPLRSRCLAIRVPLPEQNVIQRVVTETAKREKLVMPEQLAAELARASGGNLRRALLLAEATKVQRSPWTNETRPATPEWEKFIGEIATEICQEQSPKRVWEVRGKLYELLTNCIPAEVVLQRLALKLLDHLDSSARVNVVNLAAHFEHNMKMGSRPIVHLEAFVCQFMAMYRKYISDIACAAARPPTRS
eukprot:TRINITY_DN15628_c0_g1_i1.p1 TRINITY_DN15628_c0_g1~~TRINITY_DN15628_c0_g1_i1.p1  ORF type:complete len:394 (+),score=153.31 TRINITY_DN15628_c0_g1_i1:81-1184(+)